MCGRFVSSHSADRIAEFFGASFDGDALPANYNVAPTHDVYGVVAAPDTNALTTFHWGLVPSWAKDTKIASKMINARSETIAEKPAFRTLFTKHRLLIPMDGFYEWKTTEGPLGTKPVKTPMFIHRRDEQPLAVAGLWATWRDPALVAQAKEHGAQVDDVPWLHSCTVITTRANDTMAPIHNRMPVLIPRAHWDEWLDPANRNTDALLALLQPAANDVLTMHEVSTAVNSVRNNSPELTDPHDPTAPAEGQISLL